MKMLMKLIFGIANCIFSILPAKSVHQKALALPVLNFRMTMSTDSAMSVFLTTKQETPHGIISTALRIQILPMILRVLPSHLDWQHQDRNRVQKSVLESVSFFSFLGPASDASSMRTSVDPLLFHPMG